MNSSHVQRLIGENFANDNGQLRIQSHLITELTSQFETPFFVYDVSVIRRAYEKLRRAFGEAFSIYYSMKANPDPRVVSFFVEHSAGIEIASIGEFRTAVECGCSPERIIFAGPGKSESELSEAIQNGIGEIHAESQREIELINSIGESHDQTIEVCLRINPQGQNQGGAMRMGGLPAPFGIDEEIIPDVIRIASSLSHVKVCGIHLFAGTQILDAETLISQYESFIKLAEDIGAQLNEPLRTIDFGGGLGVPYFENEQPLNLDSITSRLEELSSRAKSIPSLSKARLILEPGRYLTAESGIYVARILDIKDSRGTTFVVTDGGMHHHLAASGNLGQVIKRNFPIACLNKLNRPNQQEVEIVGPLCTPLDRLGRKVAVPDLEVGDLIGIFCSGSYARSASPNDFLSHGAPVELFVDGESVSAIKVSKIGCKDG